MKKILMSSLVGLGYIYNSIFGTLTISKDRQMTAAPKHGEKIMVKLESVLESYNENRDEEPDTLQKIKVVQELIAAKADLNSVSRAGRHKGMTPLSLIIDTHCSNIRMVKLLLEAKASVDERIKLSHMELTPFGLAVHRGHKHIALLLLEHKADVNTQSIIYNNYGNVLHTVAQSAGTTQDDEYENDFLKDLLEAGADYTATDKQGKTPLELCKSQFSVRRSASPSQFEKTLQEYLKALSLECSMVLETYRLAPTVIISLVTNYLSNAQSVKGSQSSLHIVTNVSNKKACEALIAQGTYPSLQQNLNKALEEALQRGPIAYVKEFIRKGADLTKAHENGYLPLCSAAQEGRQSVVTMLLDAGAKANTRDAYNYTPLHHAAGQGHESMVTILLNTDAQPHIADNDGQTPLHRAAEHGHKSVVNIFLKAGANKNHSNKDGATPLHVAAQYGHTAIVEMLLLAGADKKAQDKDGITPLHLARKNGHNTIVEIFLKTGAQ